MMSLTWTLAGHGWADCHVEDDTAGATATASYMTAAPEDLMTAVTRLLRGDTETRAQFDAEPTTYRWIFHRGGTDVWVRLLELADSSRHDNAGTEIWSSWQTIGILMEAVISCFDDAARRNGESGYHGKWGGPFPRTELEALRAAWQERSGSDSTDG